jgi:hypothetical protein
MESRNSPWLIRAAVEGASGQRHRGIFMHTRTRLGGRLGGLFNTAVDAEVVERITTMPRIVAELSETSASYAVTDASVMRLHRLGLHDICIVFMTIFMTHAVRVSSRWLASETPSH